MIERIVKQTPRIATSWFNYGVCLDALKRFSAAAEAFEKAYAIEEDPGTQYRVFRSLALAKDEDGFFRFLDAESKKVEGLFDLLEKDEVFDEMRESYVYAELKSRG